MESHPQVENFYEIINMKRLRQLLSSSKSQSQSIEKFLNRTSNDDHIEDVWPTPEFLDMMYSPPQNPQIQATGFKWMLNQGILGNVEETIQHLNNRNVRVIVLLRKNAIRRAVSSWHQNCGKSEKYNVMDKSTMKDTGPAEISPQFLAREVSKWAGKALVLRRIHKMAKNSLFLVYEDLAENPSRYLKAIQRFIGVDDEASEMSLGVYQKLHQGEIRELVADWERKRKALEANTPLADIVKLMDDDLPSSSSSSPPPPPSSRGGRQSSSLIIEEASPESSQNPSSMLHTNVPLDDDQDTDKVTNDHDDAEKDIAMLQTETAETEMFGSDGWCAPKYFPSHYPSERKMQIAFEMAVATRQ
eukprot:CAMPEP_0185257840 /NCGR_PEP_ID=MMETSP1359-20130426/6850_1 /TAXON_ID=552665 /ORGANISM="Bigelowiella longifila, Strain CCMP242" /LENGTH=358 /DNA_ID=CAMNT_0027843095 /DNA_START=140 /DNA_END=1216 /DNA_ORIENTATION=-